MCLSAAAGWKKERKGGDIDFGLGPKGVASLLFPSSLPPSLPSSLFLSSLALNLCPDRLINEEADDEDKPRLGGDNHKATDSGRSGEGISSPQFKLDLLDAITQHCCSSGTILTAEL